MRPAGVSCIDTQGQPRGVIAGSQHPFDAYLPGNAVHTQPGSTDVAFDTHYQHMAMRSGAGKSTLYNPAPAAGNHDMLMPARQHAPEIEGHQNGHGNACMESPRSLGGADGHCDVRRKAASSTQAKDESQHARQPPSNPQHGNRSDIKLEDVCRPTHKQTGSDQAGGDACKQDDMNKEVDGHDTWHASGAGAAMPAKTHPYSHPSPYHQNMNTMRNAGWLHGTAGPYDGDPFQDGYYGNGPAMMQFDYQHMHAGHAQLPSRFSDMPMRPPPPKRVSMDTPGYAHPPAHHHLQQQQQQHPYDRQRYSLDEQRRFAPPCDYVTQAAPVPGHQYGQFNNWRQGNTQKPWIDGDVNEAGKQQQKVQEACMPQGVTQKTASASPDNNNNDVDLCSPTTHMYYLQDDQLDVDINGILSDLSPGADGPAAHTPCLANVDWPNEMASPRPGAQHAQHGGSAGDSDKEAAHDSFAVSSPKQAVIAAVETKMPPSAHASPLMMHVDLQPLPQDELISPHKMFFQRQHAQQQGQPLKTHVYPHPFHSKQAPQLPSHTSMPTHLPSAFEFQVRSKWYASQMILLACECRPKSLVSTLCAQYVKMMDLVLLDCFKGSTNCLSVFTHHHDPVRSKLHVGWACSPLQLIL